MSRSYKKYPVLRICEKNGAKWAKSRANRHFRKCADRDCLPGKSALHRKYSESWNIHDDFYRWSEKEAIEAWDLEEALISHGVKDKYRISYHLRFRTKRRFMSYWKKRVIRK